MEKLIKNEKTDAVTHSQHRLQLTVPLPMKSVKVAMSPGEDGLIGIPFPEHSNELLSRLNDQRRAGHLCDLTLTSRGARYPTHRAVMAAVSLYFRRLFGAEEGGGGGEAGGGFSVCQLDCVAPDALDALLEFAYTATLTIRSSGMREVLRGAQLLGIQCVADACRDILGEPVEAEEQMAEEGEEEEGEGGERPRPAERVPARAAAGVEKASRRKTDRKKVKKVGSHLSSLNPPPTPPVSYPSPVHSLPSTQPPSPEQEEDHLSAWQNGDPQGVREPGRRPALNGRVHWPQERPLTAQAAPASNDRLSEDEEREAFGKDSALARTAAAASSVAERAALGAGLSGGRKRKSQTPQQCPVCQKIIHGAGKLPRHMRTHTGEKPFQCTACGVRFTRNDKLKIHMRKHTGERPYPCPHCPARFLHSYDLKNHLSLHSGARPFECPLCHKAFAREDHLQRHRKGHSCLEMRTRRPRRGPGHGEDGRGDGRGDGGGREPSPLGSPSLQAHTSAFLPRGMMVGGNGAGAVPPLLFQGQADREGLERSLAFQALAQLGSHRLAAFPSLFLHGLDLRGAREAAEEDPGGTPSPAAQQDRWVEDEEEEMGEDEEEDE